MRMSESPNYSSVHRMGRRRHAIHAERLREEVQDEQLGVESELVSEALRGAGGTWMHRT